MSKAQHTPGPWNVQDNSDVEMGQLRVDSYAHGAVAIIRQDWHGDDTTAYADARLIAAAPELLDRLIASACAMEDALNVAMQFVGEGEVIPEAIARLEHEVRFARAAIAKALGE